MRYAKTVLLTGGVELLVRNAVASDARALRETTQRTHTQTDFLLSYPDEQSGDDEQEARSLEETERSGNEVELVAIIDGHIVGSAGVSAVRSRRKVAHRARFGISILKECWGMGIGRILMEASIDCARQAGYTQLELGSSPVEWCNRFVSFGLGYALSWSGVSSCWVGCGVSRDLVRMSRLR